MNLGENIYRFRIQKNMSQGDLADALNVSRQSVSKWENNSATPELEKLIKMSEVFGITLDDLVGNGIPSVPKSQNTMQPQSLLQISPQKIVGILLLICAFLCFLVPFSLGNADSGIIICLPFLLCGIICLKVKRHAGFFCMTALYLLLWVPMGVLSPNYIRITLAHILQLSHMAFGIVLFIWGYRINEKKVLFDRLLSFYIFFSIITFTVLITFFMLLFPGLIPTPGLLHS